MLSVDHFLTLGSLHLYKHACVHVPAHSLIPLAQLLAELLARSLARSLTHLLTPSSLIPTCILSLTPSLVCLLRGATEK